MSERSEVEAEIARLEKETFAQLVALRTARAKLAALDGRDLKGNDCLDELCVKLVMVASRAMHRKVMAYVRPKDNGSGWIEIEEVDYILQLWNPFDILDDPEIVEYLAKSPLLPTLAELRARGVRMEAMLGWDTYRLVALVEGDPSDNAVRAYATCEAPK